MYSSYFKIYVTLKKKNIYIYSSSTEVMKEKYDNIEVVKYMHKKLEAGDYKFAQNVEGLLPKMLKKYGLLEK